MRDIRVSRIGYNNRNLVFKPIYVENNQLKNNNAPYDLFYSKDITPCTCSSRIQGNIKVKVLEIMIETPDIIEIYPDYFVLYNNILWHVDQVTEENDEKQKLTSKRPKTIRKIKLSRYL